MITQRIVTQRRQNECDCYLIINHFSRCRCCCSDNATLCCCDQELQVSDILWKRLSSIRQDSFCDENMQLQLAWTSYFNSSTKKAKSFYEYDYNNQRCRKTNQ